MLDHDGKPESIGWPFRPSMELFISAHSRPSTGDSNTGPPVSRVNALPLRPLSRHPTVLMSKFNQFTKSHHRPPLSSLFNSVPSSSQTTQESRKSFISLNVISKLLAKSPFVNFSNPIDNHFYSKPKLLLAILDAVATIELCACSLECWIVREVFGYWGLLVAIALNCIRSSLFVSFDTYGNPCNPWYRNATLALPILAFTSASEPPCSSMMLPRFLLGQTQPIWMIFTWTLQFLSALIALKLCIYWWSLQLTVYHSARYELALKMLNSQLLMNYNSDLQVVISIGFLYEAIVTFMDLYLNSLFTCILEHWNLHCLQYNTSQTTSSTNDSEMKMTMSQMSNVCELTWKQFLMSYIIRLLIILTLIAYGLEWTGMYLNPANAFIQSWGVGNIKPMNHIIVYWFGPMFGVWLYTKTIEWSCIFISKIMITS
ncbi:unnamed protein product [Schistosoma margrebowiei]|uniref:Uncharacterized protein n=1 Tax=Schistosoma margrebowiei TaxID=48269 RepID=A0A183LCT3_9TREM|nr:unnamed protein product [Schistosoma margrebowiei]